jgi:hypothetical protein
LAADSEPETVSFQEELFDKRFDDSGPLRSM